MALITAPTASAHVQVRPALAAPGDPVLFQVIVPNEKDAHTVEVTLQIPKDVLPFSFEEPEGWTRENKEGPDGSLETVTWKGKLAEDGFARFSFLASTPEQEGEIVWKSIQTYDDGSVSRWIGEPDADSPAAVTKISKNAPRENAGGESAAADGETPAAEATTQAEQPQATDAAPASATVDENNSPLPVILSIVALVLAAGALILQFTRRKS